MEIARIGLCLRNKITPEEDSLETAVVAGLTNRVEIGETTGTGKVPEAKDLLSDLEMEILEIGGSLQEPT